MKNLNIIVRVVLFANACVLLILPLWIQQFGGWSPLTLPYLIGAILNFLFFILLNSTQTFSDRARLFGKISASLILSIYGLILLATAFSLVEVAQWYGWGTIFFLGLHGTLSISCAPLLFVEEKQPKTSTGAEATFTGMKQRRTNMIVPSIRSGEYGAKGYVY